MYSDDFLRFWKIYPRKVAKPEALKAWKQKADVLPPIDELVEKIIAYARTEQWQKDGGAFIPHPSTFLRQERWEDSLTIELPKPERKLDRYELANIELAKREAEFRARQALQKAAA